MARTPRLLAGPGVNAFATTNEACRAAHSRPSACFLPHRRKELRETRYAARDLAEAGDHNAVELDETLAVMANHSPLSGFRDHAYGARKPRLQSCVSQFDSVTLQNWRRTGPAVARQLAIARVSAVRWLAAIAHPAPGVPGAGSRAVAAHCRLNVPTIWQFAVAPALASVRWRHSAKALSTASWMVE